MCFLAGVVLIQQAPVLPSLWYLIPVLLFIALSLRYRWLFACALLVLGSSWAVFRAGLLLNNNLPPHLEGKEVHIVAVVSSLVQRSERYLKFTVDVESLQHLGQAHPAPAKLQLRWYYPDTDVSVGQRWRFRVKLKRPHGFQNPGGFDYEKWLFRHGIRATGYVLNAIGRAEMMRISWWSNFRQQVQRHLGQSGLFHHGLLRALSVGDRGGVNVEQWRVLQRTGTIHLLAISGLHIGLVSGFCFVIGLLMARLLGIGLLWLPAPKIGAILSMAGAGTYALLAGFTVPTQRATVMVVTVMSAVLFSRTIDVGRSLAFALFVVLILDPLSVLDTGFWLSFSAVIGIVLALNLTSGLSSRITRALCVQVALTVLLAPLVLLFFSQVSLCAPLANMIAIPVIAFAVVPLVLCGSFALATGTDEFADLFYELADKVLHILWPVLVNFAEPKWAVWVYAPDFWAVVLVLCTCLCLFLPMSKTIRLTVCLLIVFLLLRSVGAAGGDSNEKAALGAFSATVLDVGQGLSVVVKTRNHTMLYDTGARFSKHFNAGRAVIVPYLRQQRVKRIDTLVVSHGDNDHIGGMWSVLADIRTNRRLTSVQDLVPESEACVAGHRWHWDGVQFEVLSPDRADPPAHNNSSCVIKVVGKQGSLLLTGDIGRVVELELVRRYGRALRAEVLLVPHQGSQTSSSPLFIDTVAPKIAIVSAGYLNKYGHPADSVTRRYRKRRIALYNTAVEGAISVYHSVDRPHVERYRVEQRRYWFD